MGSEIQIPPFYFPGVVFSDNVLFRGDVFSVASPIVGVKKPYRKNRQFLNQPGAIFIRSFSVLPSEDYAGDSFDGVPCPSLIRLAADVTPEFVGLRAQPYFDIQKGKREFGRQKIRVHFRRSFF